MTPAWALQLPLRAAGQLGRLRCVPGLEVGRPAGDELWLRGDDLTVARCPEVQSLPAVSRYEVDHDLRLIPVGKRLPVGTLPDTTWASLLQWLEAEPPRSKLSGRITRKVTLTLVRSGEESPPNLLVTDVDSVRAWAEWAPCGRLARLSVALDLRRRWVAIRGTPLPPLPGRRYILEGRIALPAGYGFAYPISTSEAAGVLGLGDAQQAVFEADGTWSLLPDDVFVAATRGTLRLLGRHADRAGAAGGQAC